MSDKSCQIRAEVLVQKSSTWGENIITIKYFCFYNAKKKYCLALTDNEFFYYLNIRSHGRYDFKL